MANKTWYLENVREIAKERPYTFYVPSDELIKMLKVGDVVKLIFVNTEQQENNPFDSERIWVEITQIDGNDFVGLLDNKPFIIQDLNLGDEVSFQACHIIDWYDDELIDPVPPLDNYWDRCYTTWAILQDKTESINYIYRTKPENDEDSGWKILSGNETQEYIKGEHCVQFVALGCLLNIDDSFIHLLSSDIGTAFKRNEQGEWIQVDFECETKLL